MNSCGKTKTLNYDTVIPNPAAALVHVPRGFDGVQEEFVSPPSGNRQKSNCIIAVVGCGLYTWHWYNGT